MTLFSGNVTGVENTPPLAAPMLSIQDRTAAAFEHLKHHVEPLLVPGLFGSGPDHWQTRWERAYGLPRLRQENWTHPSPDDWEGALGRAIATARRPVLLIAHSLGAVLSSRWLARHGGHGIAGAFLVAPADVDETTHPDVARTRAFCPIICAPLPVPSLVIASSNDPWLTRSRAQELAQGWNAAYIEGGALGHIGSDEPLDLWQQGADALFAFARQNLNLPLD